MSDNNQQSYDNKIRKEQHNFGHLSLNLEIEILEDFNVNKHKLGDTKVLINDKLLCYVSGSEKDLFITELQEVINKYRI